jgi:putative ABC transport system permease protein
MLPTRWHKVIHDLWDNRIRTLVVALAVAVGVYAVGGVLSTQTVMLREFHADRGNALIAHAIIRTTPFDKKLAERMAQIPGVAAAEGRRTFSARVITGPGMTRDILLEAVTDFETQAVDRYLWVDGAWPTQRNEIMLEWNALDYLGVQIGETITIELGDNTRKTLRVAGTAHNPSFPTPEVLGFTLGAISPDTMRYLGLSDLYTELRLRLDVEDPDRETVRAVTNQVEDQFKSSGHTVAGTTITGESIIESIVNTSMLILSTFGWVILLLSAFLVVNTITALIAQQINQIGIMKLVGADRGQIMSMYIALVLVYGIIAFAIGIPLAVGTMYLLMTQLIEGLVNIRTDSYAVPLWVYITMGAVGLLIPVTAGVGPVWQGTRLTTYAALNDIGINTGSTKRGGIDQALLRLPQKWFQRPFLLAVRNALRHKSRLIRTVIVLTLGTALYIAVISVQASVDTTLGDFLRYHQYDVRVQLEQPQRIARIEAVALAQPEVLEVESWGMSSAVRVRPDGTESNRYALLGLPEATDMVIPVVQSGRWLVPGDTGVVINATIADEERDLRPGSTVTLDIAGRERPYSIIGIVTTDAQGPKIYMNLTAFGEANHSVGKASSLQIISHDPAGQDALAAQLLQAFEAEGLDVASTLTNQTINSQNELMFDTIIGFLIFMATLLGAVGTLGLSTTMSLNMTERIREIGVLRAVGASNGAIRRIVLLEGLVMSLLSWAMGFLLSFPTARFMSEQIGIALLDMPLAYSYSSNAAIFWLGLMLTLAIVASLGPAQQAVKLTVREVLAYE